jgi:hypothetical protein
MSDVSTEYLEFSFGPFRLIPERQLLVEGQKPVNLGAPDLESPSYPKRALISPVCAEYSESVYLFHFVGF